jgi:hypothetical protein
MSVPASTRTAVMRGLEELAKGAICSRIKQQTEAEQGSAGVPRGPPVLSTTVCLCLSPLIGRVRLYQHGS